MIGTGGVGRAIAFGLVGLGCKELRLVDRDMPKAEALAADIRKTAPDVKVVCGSNAEALADGAQGIVNCTPVGMVGYDGTPLAEWAMAGAGLGVRCGLHPAEHPVPDRRQGQRPRHHFGLGAVLLPRGSRVEIFQRRPPG